MLSRVQSLDTGYLREAADHWTLTGVGADVRRSP